MDDARYPDTIAAFLSRKPTLPHTIPPWTQCAPAVRGPTLNCRPKERERGIDGRWDQTKKAAQHTVVANMGWTWRDHQSRADDDKEWETSPTVPFILVGLYISIITREMQQRARWASSVCCLARRHIQFPYSYSYVLYSEGIGRVDWLLLRQPDVYDRIRPTEAERKLLFYREWIKSSVVKKRTS